MCRIYSIHTVASAQRKIIPIVRSSISGLLGIVYAAVIKSGRAALQVYEIVFLDRTLLRDNSRSDRTLKLRNVNHICLTRLFPISAVHTYHQVDTLS